MFPQSTGDRLGGEGPNRRRDPVRGILLATPPSMKQALVRRLFAIAVAALAAISISVRVVAQNRMSYSLVAQDSGHVALGLALRKLSVSGTFLQAPAHPDDETNALFAFSATAWGCASIDLQNNRGDGGQNEIGPELFRDMAVLRTSELLAAHRIDGAEQYFTRAIDYGYSFDPEEVIDKWGRKDIVGDYVRLFRTLRPDVVVTMNIQGRGGDRAHEATTILVREAYLAAGDPVEVSRADSRRAAAVAGEEAVLLRSARASGAAASADAAGTRTRGGRQRRRLAAGRALR